ncbi:hypothetical protein AB0B57_02820 [Micromonospora sp. NPDC049101]|uniref:hypothetical protein n=1 Tax=Micromonospora sp. NPDC049101 TaxID=3155032 RepID=UPI003406142B
MRRIIAVYSRRGAAVVDFDGDPTVRNESIAAGRTYRPVTHAADLAGLDTVEQIDLVVLRWPRPQPPARPRPVDGAVADLFRTLRRVITPDGFAVLLVEQRPARPTPTEVVHLAGLVPRGSAGPPTPPDPATTPAGSSERQGQEVIPGRATEGPRLRTIQKGKGG